MFQLYINLPLPCRAFIVLPAALFATMMGWERKLLWGGEEEEA
jgi:hypothetical protein